MILTESNYFSQEAEMHYMGSTQFKNFMQCERAALARTIGEYSTESTTALLVGSYVDNHFSKTLDVFIAQHPEIITKSGTLKADYEYANQIIQRIESDQLFMWAMSGEKQVIMTGEISGVAVKIKVDSLLPNITIDMKIMRDFESVYSAEEGRRVPWWKAWGYDIQAAIYQEIRRQNDGVRKPFGIAGATKEKPEPSIGLFQFEQSVLDDALNFVEENIAYYDMIKKCLVDPTECGKCDYCKSKRVLTGFEMLS